MSIFSWISIFACLGCASAPSRSDRLVFDEGVTLNPLLSSDVSVPTLSLLWTRKLGGHLADLTLSKNGKSLLVSTYPNADDDSAPGKSPNNPHRHVLAKWNSDGRMEWHTTLLSQQKSQDLSEDGTFAIVSNFNNELIAYGPDGKVLWNIEGTCKPEIINRSKRILCLHDDDVHAGVIFEVFNWSGQRLLTFPAQDDLISARLSDDEKNLVVGLSGGEVGLINSAFHWKWQKEVPGKIVDVSVSNGDQPTLAVLYWDKNLSETLLEDKASGAPSSQRIAIFDATGKLLQTLGLHRDGLQVQLARDGGSVFYYGNSARGQSIGGFDLKQGEAASPWIRGEQNTSDYSTAISITPSVVVMGVEHFEAESRQSHILGFDYSGNLQWDLPTLADPGAYLYTQRVAASTGILAVGTDDSRLSLYQINKKVQPSNKSSIAPSTNEGSEGE